MTDPLTTLAARLRAGEQLFLGWSAYPEPLVADALARAGFDAVLLDMQHGLHDVASATRSVQYAAAAGCPALVRVPVGDFAAASRMLDAGAAGIVAPMINSAADAAALAAFSKYPPVGERSWGPGRAMAISGMGAETFLARANDAQLAFAMIETPRALSALDEILATDGIDGVLVGPADLSITLNNGAALDPAGEDVTQAMSQIAGRCTHFGKIPAAFCANGPAARIAAGLGFRLCAVGTDASLLDLAARQQLELARTPLG